jgi:hypothetical protein
VERLKVAVDQLTQSRKTLDLLKRNLLTDFLNSNSEYKIDLATLDAAKAKTDALRDAGSPDVATSAQDWMLKVKAARNDEDSFLTTDAGYQIAMQDFNAKSALVTLLKNQIESGDRIAPQSSSAVSVSKEK